MMREELQYRVILCTNLVPLARCVLPVKLCSRSLVPFHANVGLNPLRLHLLLVISPP